MHLSHGVVARERIQVLLAHRAARDLALTRCWIKHRRGPGTELSVVIEEHAGWGGEIAESEMGCRILNRQGTGVELPGAFAHREAQDAALLGVIGRLPVLVEYHRCPRPGMVEYFIPNWLRVFRSVSKGCSLPRGVERERETTAVWSEKCVARCGSEYDDMRMITTRFVRVLQRRAGPLCTHFLLIFPEVRSTNKTSK